MIKRREVKPGDKFGYWTVIEEAPSKKNIHNKAVRMVYVECICGKRAIRHLNNLTKSGASQSCGCGCVPRIRNLKHGHYHHPLNHVWRGMKVRCYDPNNRGYKRYGARGISVCDEWINDYEAFYQWAINNGYKEGLTLDRINNDGNYMPENCRWVDYIVQSNNRSSNVLFSIDGETLTMIQVCRKYGVVEHYDSIRSYVYKKNASTEEFLAYIKSRYLCIDDNIS